MDKRILIVDGMALLFRGYYATAYRGNFMKNENGNATNGVYQFLRYLTDAYVKFAPTHIIACWDMGKETFRTELYPEYKANRDDPPEELIVQFDMVKEVVSYFGIPNIGIPRIEADDLIGSLVKKYGDYYELIVLTGDYDLLQLVQRNVTVAIMRKGIGNYELFHESNFYEKKGLYPHQITDFKGFTGDGADNYPGIKGIGEKTATKLLQTYGDIDGVLANKNELSKGIREKIEANLSMFYLSKELATIKTDVVIPISLEQSSVQFNVEKIDAGLKHYGIRIPSIEQLLK